MKKEKIKNKISKKSRKKRIPEGLTPHLGRFVFSDWYGKKKGHSSQHPLAVSIVKTRAKLKKEKIKSKISKKSRKKRIPEGSTPFLGWFVFSNWYKKKLDHSSQHPLAFFTVKTRAKLKKEKIKNKISKKVEKNAFRKVQLLF